MLQRRKDFWTQAISLQGSVTPRVAPRVAAFTAFSVVIYLLDVVTHWNPYLAIAPYEVAGAVLGVLMVMRTNAGYERWWEARKLWGGIVNQSRNLAVMGLTYGPADPDWRKNFANLVALFPHAARSTLRGDEIQEDAARLLGRQAAAALDRARHKAVHVAQALAAVLRQTVDRGSLDRFAYLQMDRERALLIDYIGACERILKTPLPTVYAIKVRRFILLFLTTLPFALLDRAGWLTPGIVAFVAYSLLALDQIGVELEDPFSSSQLSHLPLGEICLTIEQNIQQALAADPLDLLPATPLDQDANGVPLTALRGS